MSSKSCSECRSFLHAYVDDELDVRASLEVKSHIDGCHACAARYRQLCELSQTIRSRASRFTPSAELQERLRSSLRGDSARADVVRGPWTRRVAIAGSLAAAIVLAWCGGAWWSRPGAQQQLGAEVISAHVRSLVGDHLIDVQSSDRHTVNPWFQGKVPFAPGARDFTPLGFALAGGRLDYLDGRTVAALVYRHGPHSINVFVWPAEEDGDERVTNFGARGYSACHWVQDGLIHWAVTDADASTLTKLVDLLRAKD